MQAIYPELQALSVDALAVTFTPAVRLKSFEQEMALPFPIVSDPDFAGYKTFELGRAGVLKFLRPDVIWRFLRMMFGGWKPRMPTAGDDVRQLGGDFLLDAQGRLRFAHPSSDPTDHPSNAMLLEQAGYCVKPSG